MSRLELQGISRLGVEYRFDLQEQVLAGGTLLQELCKQVMLLLQGQVSVTNDVRLSELLWRTNHNQTMPCKPAVTTSTLLTLKLDRF